MDLHGPLRTVMPVRRGFSLMELIITLLILATVSTIAVFGFRLVLAKSAGFNASTSVRMVAIAEQNRWQNRSRFLVDPQALAQQMPTYTFLAGSEPSLAQNQVSIRASEWNDQPAVVIASAAEQMCAVALVVDPQLSEPMTGRYVITPTDECSAEVAEAKVGTDPWW